MRVVDTPRHWPVTARATQLCQLILRATIQSESKLKTWGNTPYKFVASDVTGHAGLYTVHTCMTGVAELVAAND